MGKPIAVAYGSTTCYTQMVAERVLDLIGESRADLINIAERPLLTLLQYEQILFGIPTWDYGELQEDWDDRWDELAQLNLRGKRCAIFGLGDQIGYPDWFQDAMGYLYHQLVACGAQMAGLWPNQGYQFADSKALDVEGSHFLGLPLDEENQSDLTDLRLKAWLTQLGLLKSEHE